MVECSGINITPEVDLISMKMFTWRENTLLANLNILRATCQTHGVFSSCHLQVSETKRSSLRILVSDLRAGESTVIGCNVSTFSEIIVAPKYTWLIVIRGQGKSRVI